MRVKNYNFATVEDRFSGRLHHAFISGPIKHKLDIDFDRWIIYNEIIEQIDDLGYKDLHYELEDRVKNNEDVNEVFKSIINRNSDTKSTIGYHLNTIQHYIDEDFIKMFK